MVGALATTPGYDAVLYESPPARKRGRYVNAAEALGWTEAHWAFLVIAHVRTGSGNKADKGCLLVLTSSGRLGWAGETWFEACCRPGP